MPFYDHIKACQGSRRPTQESVDLHFGSVNSEDDKSLSLTSQITMTPPLTHTQWVILDYRQFKAARIIQRNWRPWHQRLLNKNRGNAAITIQRWWRGFRVRNNFTLLMEEKLQNAILAHYDRAATKIQALFRGWWIRQTAQDMGGKTKLQTCAVEDLLHCVAYKLHHMLRTYSIPGVYSLANTHCLSRVEKLLSSMKYRFYNAEVRHRMITRDINLHTQRKRYVNNQLYTEVPYKGPNYKGNCKSHCEEYLTRGKDLDRRMYKIIAAYDESQREVKNKITHSLAEKMYRKRIRNILERKKKTKHDFCGDIIVSMRRWNIWDDEQLTIDKEIFQTPQNLESFLSEVSHLLSDLSSCYCQTPDILRS